MKKYSALVEFRGLNAKPANITPVPIHGKVLHAKEKKKKIKTSGKPRLGSESFWLLLLLYALPMHLNAKKCHSKF